MKIFQQASLDTQQPFTKQRPAEIIRRGATLIYCKILFFLEPEIPEPQRVAVILQHERAFRHGVSAEAARRRLDTEMVMDENAVLANRQDGVFNHLAFGVEFRRRVVDIIRLPRFGRQAHVHDRTALLVDAAALVVAAFKCIAVENLHFDAALRIDAAVATALSTRFGHVGRLEFDMHDAGAVFGAADDAATAATHFQRAAVFADAPAFAAHAAVFHKLPFDGFAFFRSERLFHGRKTVFALHGERAGDVPRHDRALLVHGKSLRMKLVGNARNGIAVRPADAGVGLPVAAALRNLQ